MIKAISFSLLILCSYMAKADVISIYIWEESFSDKVIEQFERLTGHTIKQVHFDSEMLRDEMLVSGRAEQFDIIILDALTLAVYSKKGLLFNFQQASYDYSLDMGKAAQKACGNYGIPYIQGTLGIAYRQSKLSSPISSWKQVFGKQAKWQDKTVFPLDHIDTPAIALLAQNEEPFSSDGEKNRRVYQLLKEAKERGAVFSNGMALAIEKGIAFDKWVAVVYSGESQTIAQVTGQQDWQYVIPKEGTIQWFECFTSTVNREPNQATREFLDYISTPKVAIQNAQDQWFTTSNKSALSLASHDYLNDQELFPKLTSNIKLFQYRVPTIYGLQIRSRIVSEIGYKDSTLDHINHIYQGHDH